MRLNVRCYVLIQILIKNVDDAQYKKTDGKAVGLLVAQQRLSKIECPRVPAVGDAAAIGADEADPALHLKACEGSEGKAAAASHPLGAVEAPFHLFQLLAVGHQQGLVIVLRPTGTAVVGPAEIERSACYSYRGGAGIGQVATADEYLLVVDAEAGIAARNSVLQQVAHGIVDARHVYRIIAKAEL